MPCQVINHLLEGSLTPALQRLDKKLAAWEPPQQQVGAARLAHPALTVRVPTCVNLAVRGLQPQAHSLLQMQRQHVPS